MPTASRAVHSSLAIGRKPKKLIKDSDKDPDVFIMHCTAQNRSGVKYAVRKNIEAIFTKFVDDGKATLRFIKPQHDLCIKKADVVQLKAFLTVVKQVLSLKANDDEGLDKLIKLNCSALCPASTNQVAKSKTKLVIVEKKDYPITSSFPHTLTELRAVGINLKRLDSRILKLKGLTCLDLTGNNLSELPADFNKLGNLKELILSGNKIVKIAPSFAQNPTFCRSLVSLDLTGNQIKYLPVFMESFKSLSTLKLGSNPIAFFPGGMLTKSLMVLDLKDMPELKHLPSTASSIYVNELFVSVTSQFMANGRSECKVVHDTLAKLPMLLDLCSRQVIKYNLRPRIDERIVPPVVIKHMDSLQRCICGDICYKSSHAAAINELDLGRIASTVHGDSGSCYAKVIAVYCSKACLKRFQRGCV